MKFRVVTTASKAQAVQIVRYQNNKRSVLQHIGSALHAEINTGINQFRHFVFVGKFEILEAQVVAAKAAYLASVILTDKDELTKFSEKIPLTDYLIANTNHNFLNKRLKFAAKDEALFYWFHTIKLLTN